MAEQEYSESGDPIYRYKTYQPKELTPADGDAENIEAICNHIETNIGKIECVFHEIVSHIVHIDVYWVKPSRNFPFHTLVTSGMSDRPMKTSEKTKKYKYVELCMLLPNNWIIEGDEELMKKVFADENNYWPIRWLKDIAVFPHEYDTWVGYGHTIPNGQNADPVSKNAPFGCMMLLPSLSLGPQFFKLKINNEKTILFYCLFPLFKEEMEYKLKKGVDALITKFEKYDIIDLVDINRVNTCLKKGFLGLW